MSKEASALGNILEYYRKRVDEIQKERDDWFEQLEKFRISQEDFHKLEWELKRKSEETADLQKSLSDAQVALFDEREEILLLKREIADFKALSIEDRNKILQLLTLNAKQEENQYYFKDITAQHCQLYPKTLPVPDNKESLAIPRAKLEVKKTEPPAVKKHKKKHKRKVNIKEDYVASLHQQIEDLKALNDKQKAEYEAELKALKEDRVNRETQVQIDHNSAQEKIAELLGRVHKLESEKADLMKDYLTERMKYQGNERRLQEENELLRLEQGELRNTLQNVIAKAESDIKHTANTTEKKADEVVQKYRRQAQVQNENLLIIQEQYKRIQEMYLTKIKTLEGQLDKLQKKYKELRTRRNLEIEGYKTDIGQIRKKTRIYDEYLHRVKKLIDENPARAIELAKSQELNVDPIKEQLEGMEARLGKTKAETNYATVPQEHEVVEPEKEEAKD